MQLFAPMLAEPLAEGKLMAELATNRMVQQLMASPDQGGETKVDGERLLVHVEDGKVVPVNRKGEPTSIPSRAIAEAFETLTTGVWAFDGELVAGVMHVFDLPRAGMAVTPDMPYSHRRAVLEQFMSKWNPGPCVQLLPSYTVEADKRDLLARVAAHGGEGIMLKDMRAPYVPGKRSDKVRKVKLWKSCEVIVTELSREGKDNVVMEMICPRRGRVEVGTASRIGKGPIQAGDVLEVKFLYAVDRERPKLYQPSILRVRLDKTFDECTVDQLERCYTDKTVIS
jgi:ATP-dependent DNA ligase